MKLVLHLSQMNWDIAPEKMGPLLAELASMAEDAGFDGIAVADHLWQHPLAGGPIANSMEAYTTLAFLAAHTSSVRLFTLATGAHFRKPGLLAKTVTTLDVLSGGRAWLGIGAGHYAEECDGLGVPFPPTRKRYELLEDALEVCTRMWEGEHGVDVPYTGHHVSASRLLNVPQVLRRPTILIAGTGERRTSTAWPATWCHVRHTSKPRDESGAVRSRSGRFVPAFAPSVPFARHEPSTGRFVQTHAAR